jgi:hypothetical protein
LGFPEEDLDLGEDRLSDTQGGGPDIWFQKVHEGSRKEPRTGFGL